MRTSFDISPCAELILLMWHDADPDVCLQVTCQRDSIIWYLYGDMCFLPVGNIHMLLGIWGELSMKCDKI